MAERRARSGGAGTGEDGHKGGVRVLVVWQCGITGVVARPPISSGQLGTYWGDSRGRMHTRHIQM